jgi:hypothetical protein
MCLTVAVGASACGVAANDTAATVGDTTISATLVNDLVASDAFMSAMSSQALQDQREGVVDGPAARQVLSFLITSEVMSQEVQRWKAKVTDADTSEAESTIDQQAPNLRGRARDVVLRFLVDRAALQARLSEIDPSSDADMRRLYDGVPSYWDQVCITAVVVPATAVAEAHRALAGGVPLEDMESKVQGSKVAALAKQCLPRQYLPEKLRAAIAKAATGKLVGPVADVFDGDDAVVFFRVQSVKVVSFSDAATELRQLVQSIAQQGVSAWLNLKANSDVVVDPRYGSDVEVGQQGLTVLAPAVPLGTPAATGAAPVSEGGSAGGSAGSAGATP